MTPCANSITYDLAIKIDDIEKKKFAVWNSKCIKLLLPFLRRQRVSGMLYNKAELVVIFELKTHF